VRRIYIWDSNALRAWVDARSPHNGAIHQAFNGLYDQFVRLSVVVNGEVEYGLALKHGLAQATADTIRSCLRELPALVVDEHDAETYGDLRARLFDRYGPKELKRKISVSQLFDPATDKTLGIQENDVWLAAQAVTRDAVLISYDRMTRIRSVAPELRLVGLDGQPVA
jgi:tRNA(fMet)-specific endonuclease VapC